MGTEAASEVLQALRTSRAEVERCAHALRSVIGIADTVAQIEDILRDMDIAITQISEEIAR